MNAKLISHIALWLAALIYGANYTIAKSVMPQYVQPFAFIILRVIGALVLYWLVSLFFKQEKIEKKDFPRLIACGIFGVAVNQLLFFKGLSLTSPINAAIMMLCTPILVLIISFFAIKEKLTWVKIVGVFIGLSGALLLIFQNTAITSVSQSNPLGDFFILINALSWGIYLVIVKSLMQKYSTLTVIKWSFLFGSLIVIPVGFNEFQLIDWANMPSQAYASIAFVVIGVTFLAYFLNTYALKQLSPTVVSIYIYLQPILASLIAIISKKDELSFYKVCAALLIFVGVYLVSFNPIKYFKKI
ncbi:MAG: DMT family transporter [Bacteroidota bacterium]